MSTPDRFDCAEVFQRLDDYLDRELAPEEQRRVQEHLDQCARCAAEERFEAGVLRQVREKLRHVALPENVLAGIRRALDGSREENGS